MKSLRIYILPAVLFFLVFSCKKKEYPEPQVTGEPVFYFKGNIDGEVLDIKAGVNDYYMYSSYTQDANNVYNLIGHLKPTNCNSCANSIQIQINDFRQSPLNSNVKIDSALLLGLYPFRKDAGAPLYYTIQYKSFLKNAFSSTYAWDFDSKSNSSQANGSMTFKNFTKPVTCLSVMSNSASCTTNICNNYNLNLADYFNSYISVEKDSVNGNSHAVTFKANIIDGGSTSYVYEWDFGTGETSNETQPTYTFNTGSIVWPVKVKIWSANNKTSEANYNWTGANTGSNCCINYSVSAVTPIVNNHSLSNIIVKYTDNQGNIYTSDHSSQPSSSCLQVISVENYKNNENNDLTKKIKIKFNCKVYSSSGKSLSITNAEAVIALAYK